MTIWSIGHSNHPIEQFLGLLKQHDITQLVDIRTLPRSRYNPQYNEKILAASLKAAGIAYTPIKALGGRRKARPDSKNTAFHDGGFRGYADYMQTETFQLALDRLITISHTHRTAFMCAEAKPTECHRSLVSDALVMRGAEVTDILADATLKWHALNPLAHTQNGKVFYPARMKDLFEA
jgi:uncharacterized protein (DUF488 family)